MKNKKLIFITFWVFHLEISGNVVKEEHLPNNPDNFLTLFMFHFEISGKDTNDLHS